MKYKEFRKWCSQRASDGCWGMFHATCCIHVLAEIEKLPFWKRERFWREKYMENVMNDIVNPIEKKISETRCVKM